MFQPLHGLLRQMGQPLDGAPSKQIEEQKTVPSFQFRSGALFFRNKQAKKITVPQDGAL